MKVLVEKVTWATVAKTGKDYLQVDTNQGRLSVFNRDHIQILVDGAGKYFEMDVQPNKAGYPEIQSLSVLDDSKSSVTLDKDRLIVRQSCLKAAVELILKHPTGYQDATVMTEDTCKMAEQFEKWVYRE